MTIDQAVIFRELTAVTDAVGSGGSPRQGLVRTLELARRATGAAAGCFITVEGRSMRVVAATHDATWLEGRLFPFGGSVLAALLADRQRSRVVDAADAATSIQPDLSARGLRRMALSRVDRGARGVGALVVIFGDPAATLPPVTRQVFEYLAAFAGSLAWTRPDAATDPFGVAAAMPDGLAVLDPDGLVRSWNPAAHQLSGRSPVDAIGRRPPFEVPQPGQVLETHLENGRWIELRSSPPDPGGNRVVTFRDVTAPRLENEERDLFLATTGHELRTPLTVVKGYAETLANRWENLDEEAKLTAVRTIRDRTRQLAVLVDRLLLADSSDTGELTIERGPFDLRTTLLAAVRGAPPPENTQPPVLDVPEFLPWASGDRRTIGMIVNELLTNADKYSPVGGEVTISADADASSVCFRVADRGIGVSPDHVDAVFSRFWQAEAGDQRRFGGVGLGLYIIRRLLDRQGGWVSMRPRPDGGTVVEVRLPRADAPHPATRVLPRDKTSTRTTTARGVAAVRTTSPSPPP